jgi:hypothetical protein
MKLTRLIAAGAVTLALIVGMATECGAPRHYAGPCPRVPHTHLCKPLL